MNSCQRTAARTDYQARITPIVAMLLFPNRGLLLCSLISLEASHFCYLSCVALRTRLAYTISSARPPDLPKAPALGRRVRANSWPVTVTGIYIDEGRYILYNYSK